MPRFIKIFILIIRCRVVFLLGFVPGLKILRVFLNSNSEKQAQNLRLFLEKMGPCFVKFGQMLSVRSDLVGETFAKALTGLREETKRSNFEKIKKSISESVHKSYLHCEILKSHLVASGSVAEVYKTTIINNGIKLDVAVKVLKPSIRELFIKDIKFLRRLFKLIESVQGEMHRLKISRIVDAIERNISFETDLRFEAAAAEEIKVRFSQVKQASDLVYIPKVYWHLSSKSVMVLEWVNGAKTYETNKLKSMGISGHNIVSNLFSVFFHQVIKFGIFHGDMHPGNFIMMNQGKVALIDFGIMGKISISVRRYIFQIWSGLLNQNYKHAASAYFDAGWIDSSKYSVDELAMALRSVISPVFSQKPLETIVIGSVIEQLATINKLFGMETRKELLLIQKNMMFLEGVAREVAPSVNIWKVARDILNSNEFQLSCKQKLKHANSYIVQSKQETKALIRRVLEKSINQQDHHNITRKTNYVIILILLIIIALIYK